MARSTVRKNRRASFARTYGRFFSVSATCPGGATAMYTGANAASRKLVSGSE